MRKPIRPKDRFEVFKRDKFTCQYCGRKPPEVVLQVDHIIAVVNDGTNSEENLVTACETCNSGKGGRPLDVTLTPLTTPDADRVERLKQLEAYREFLYNEQETAEECIADLLEGWAKREGQPTDRDTFSYQMPTKNAMRQFFKRLPMSEIFDAMDITFTRMENKPYARLRYFCGVCWKKIRDREDEALVAAAAHQAPQQPEVASVH